jgi:hypothetical protein
MVHNDLIYNDIFVIYPTYSKNVTQGKKKIINWREFTKAIQKNDKIYRYRSLIV